MGSRYDGEWRKVIESFREEVKGQVRSLDEKTQCLLRIACVTAAGAKSRVRDETEQAIKAGVSVTQIKETIYQTAPYAGFTKAEDALKKANRAIEALGLDPEENSQQTVTKKTRFEQGLAVQEKIFGEEATAKMRASAPEDLRHIQDDLSADCFGDNYTRGCLDLKMRELITFTVIISIGGCDPQARAHAEANLSVGNSRQDLIDAATLCLPYIGYPRTLNAISAVNAATEKKPEA